MVVSSPPTKAGCSVPGAFFFMVRDAVNFSFASTGKALAAGENRKIWRFGAERRKNNHMGLLTNVPSVCLPCPAAAVSSSSSQGAAATGGAWRNLLFPLPSERFLKRSERAQTSPPASQHSGEPEAQVVQDTCPPMAAMFKSAPLNPMVYNARLP